MNYRIPLLSALAAIASVRALPAQIRADERADSIMRYRDELFDDAADTAGRTSIESDRVPWAQKWMPTFDAQFDRVDLIGYHDREFPIAYDRANGLRLTAGSDLPMALLGDSRLRAHASVGYSFASHFWHAAGELRRDFLGSSSPLRIGIEGHVATGTRDAWKMDRVENTLFAFVGGNDARDYFKRIGFSISLEQFLEPRTSLGISYHGDENLRLQRAADWSIFGPAHPFREVPRIREGTLKSVVASAQTDYITLRRAQDFQFGIAAAAEFGSIVDRNAPQPKVITEWSFESYVVDARMKSPLITNMIGVAVRLRLGASTGNVPAQRMFSIGGVGTVAGYPQNEYWGDRLVVLGTEIIVHPLRHGPLRGLRLVIANDVAAVDRAHDRGNDDLLAIFDTPIAVWKYSPGVYIATSTARVRLGVAWRTDIASTPQFVIRLSQVF